MWDLPRPGFQSLYCKVDSLPLSHQRSPQLLFLSSKLLQNLATESYFLCSWVLRARNLEWVACRLLLSAPWIWASPGKTLRPGPGVIRRLVHSQVSRCLDWKHLRTWRAACMPTRGFPTAWRPVGLIHGGSGLRKWLFQLSARLWKSVSLPL